MTGLIMKLIACPLTIVFADALFRGVRYASIYQSIGVGLILAVLAHLLETVILKKGTLWISTIADFGAAFVIIYFSQYFLRNARVTFTGALLTAILVALIEYFVHTYLINADKTKKVG